MWRSTERARRGCRGKLDVGRVPVIVAGDQTQEAGLTQDPGGFEGIVFNLGRLLGEAAKQRVDDQDFVAQILGHAHVLTGW